MDMKEQFSFKFLGTIQNFNFLLNSVSAFTEEEWNKYSDRKKTGGMAAANSDTIPLIYDPRSNFESRVEHEKYEEFKIYIDEISKIAIPALGCNEPKQAMFTRLHARSEIKKHKDKGPVTAKTHRVHLSIITNEMCIFTVGEESLNMRAGDVWVIDNVGKYHSVSNGGDIHRIHLIVDFA